MELSSAKIKKFQEVTFGARKIKKTHSEKFLIFQETELSSLKLKKLLTFSYFSVINLQSLKSRNLLYFLHFRMTANQAVK